MGAIMKTKIASLLVAVMLAAAFFWYMLPANQGKRDAERTIAMCDRLAQEWQQRLNQDASHTAKVSLSCIAQHAVPNLGK